MQNVLDDGLLTLLHTAAAPWLLLDAQQRLRACNSAARQLLGEAASIGMVLPLARAGEWQGAPLPADMLPCQLDSHLFGLLPGLQANALTAYRLVPLQDWHEQEQKRRQREHYLQILSDLAASSEKDRLHRLDSALAAGAAALGMEIAFVAQRKATQLEIIACHAGNDLSRGKSLPLDLTYCERTLQNGQLLCLPDVLETALADSACYREFRFRAYIGIPLLVQGRIFGTLAFCASAPRAPFSSADTEFVQHLARWTAVVVERKLAADEAMQTQQAMEEQLGWLRLAGQVARLGHWSYAPQDGQVSLSQEACRLLAVEPRPLLPLVEVERRMLVQDRQRWRDALQHSLQQRTPLAVEVRLRHGDSGYGWLALRAQVVEREGEPLLFGVLMDVTDAKESQQLIQYQASHDALTGCINRTLLFDRLGQEIRRAERLHQQFAVMFVDLDRFKQVNDRYGHAAGDKVLQTVADRLMALLRRSDTVARVGGDEFVLLIPQVSDELTLATLARKVEMAIDRPVRDEGALYRVSASIGVALYPEDGDEPELLLRAADRKMYSDKSHAARH
ncbi:diguanylate cyclase domain-containing protein [Vogesella sp. EB]|uniref:sensor domain-containing protein n=1 Tax=Vogesella sp. EB TaxID=1526735 RepID=UPI00069E2E36|nr:diguanylate cyclase [Vogesella sp. EB]